jgi:two-component sensor histidine kinase
MTDCDPGKPMQASPEAQTWREAERLAALRRHDILDTPAEAEFDDIARIAAHVCNAPMAMISFVDADRHFYKAEIGLGIREASLEASMCAQAIRQTDLLVVSDLAADPRFSRNPFVAFVPGVRFYAGAVMETADKLPLGTVCVLDTKPRPGLSTPEAQALRALARQVIAQLELRSLLRAAKASEAALAQAVCERDTLLQEKDLLMAEVHHRVKNSLQLVQTLVTLQSRDVADPKARAQLEETAGRIMTIGAVHGRLYTGGSVINSQAEPFLTGLVRDIEASVVTMSDRPVELVVEPMVLSADRLTALGLVITELVTNALKYGSGRILVSVRRVEDAIEVAVEDEGVGFPEGFDVAQSGNLGMRLVAAMSIRGRQATWLDRASCPSRIVTLLPAA